MFKFLKEKIKSFFKPAAPLKEVKKIEKKKAQKIEKKPAKELKKEIKGKRKRNKQELEEERKIGRDIIQDIKKEKGEDIHAVPKLEIEEEPEVKEKAEEIKVETKEKKAIEEKPVKKSFFERIGLIKRYKITEEDFEEIFSGLEEIMLENNFALDVVDYLKESLKKELIGFEVKKDEVENKITQALKKSLESIFPENLDIIKKIKSQEGVFKVVFFGINGTGKTTSIAKLAHLLKQNGISSVFSASDTFRAASIEQIKKHGENLGVKVISQNYGADPAAVAFDAIEYAKAHKIKVVLIDTAGRMHTESSLMKEMEKIVRVTKPDLRVFIAESIAGNDALEQVRAFNDAVGIDGIMLSKADVDEKGGTSFSMSYVTKKPILFLGVGQEYKDLEVFDKKKIVDAIFS